MSDQGLAALDAAFSYDVAQTTNLFRAHVENPRLFGTMKNLYQNGPR
jgi:hypothetical protein